MAIRIPGPETINGAANMTPQGPLLQADTSAIGRGVQALGVGVEQIGGALAEQAAKIKKEQDLSQVSLAEAEYMRGMINLKNDLSQNNDYTTLGQLADTGSMDIMASAAEKISDPKLRKSWQQETELKRLGFLDDVQTRAIGLQHDEALANFQTSLDAQLVSAQDATIPRDQRQAAVDAGLGSLQRAKDIGLITPGQFITQRDDFLTKANQGWAINHYQWMIQTNPAQAAAELNSGADGGTQSVAANMIAANNGPIQFSPDIAKMVAVDLKDASLPQEPDLQKAYLDNPKTNALYASNAVTVLARDQFGGDMGAAIVALAPGADMKMAAQFAKDHDLSKLPAGVRGFFESVQQSQQPSTMDHVPIIADPKVHLENINGEVLNRYEALQTAFGKQLVITSGFRDPKTNADAGGVKGSQHIHGDAIDVDWSNLSEEERVRFIQTASAIGFTGIGIYKNHVHLDIGNRRAWGPSTHADSVPDYAQAVVAQHMAGSIETLPMPNMKLPPAARLLTPDQRMSLISSARGAAQEQSVTLRDSIETTVKDAPSSMATTGRWDGPTLRPNDFVQAYGSKDGIEKYRAYSAAMDVAAHQFQFRTASEGEITAAVAAARPTSSGSGAEVAAQRFTAMQQAAQETLAARAKDPAGYVSQVFDKTVGVAWQNATTPEGIRRAINITSLAERQLGMRNLALLPQGVADSIATTFTTPAVPQQTKVDAVLGVLSAATTDDDRAAIMNQLVKSGVPNYVNRALAASADGRSQDARILFEAATLDPKTDLVDLSAQDKSKMDDAINNIFSGSNIGAVFYSTDVGIDSANLARAAQDKVLLERVARLHMMAGMSPEAAVNMASGEFFGDVKAVVGNGNAGSPGYRIVLPSSADEQVYRNGFRGIMPDVASALSDKVTTAIIGAVPANAPAMKAAAQARDSYVRAVMQSGFFSSIGNGKGYVFINPKTNSPVTNRNGDPMVFTDAQVMSAASGYVQGEQDRQNSLLTGMP